LINSLFYTRKDNQKLFWFIFHVALGIIATISKPVLIFWFYFLFLVQFYKIFTTKKLYFKKIRLIYLLFYLSSFEILTRMAHTSPIIPDEIGKYFNFVLLTYGIIISSKIRDIGYYMLLLLIPGILSGYQAAPDYRYIVFNILGIINLCLGIVFFGKFVVHNIRVIFTLLRLLTYSLISALSFAIIRTPDYSDLSYTLNANFDVSGGFGSNQVSTAFGLGFFIMFYLWYKKIKVIGYYRIFDLILCLLFLFQGLLTFSRGGIIGGAIGVLLLFFYSGNKINNFLSFNNLKLIVFSIPLLILALFIANNLTHGNLLLRYQGETNSTLRGVVDKDLNHLTTNRLEIFLGDLDLFKNHPVFGVGVSNSMNLRIFREGVSAHVELSRLLAEHGIFGLIFAIIITYLFVIQRYKLRSPYSILYILAIIGLFTTFHAATRTFISPLLIPLMLVGFKSINKLNLAKTDSMNSLKL